MRFLSRKGKKPAGNNESVGISGNGVSTNLRLSRTRVREESGGSGVTSNASSSERGSGNFGNASFERGSLSMNGNASFERYGLGSRGGGRNGNATFERGSLSSNNSNASFDRASLGSRRGSTSSNAAFDRVSLGSRQGLPKQRKSSKSGSNGNIYKVQIPASTKPGEEFQVKVRSRVVKIKCPANARPGQYLQITVPEEEPQPQQLKNGDYDDSWHVERLKDNDNDNDAGNDNDAKLESVMIRIPPATNPGDSFPVRIGGMPISVTCPRGAQPGMQVKITIPRQPPAGPSAGGAAGGQSVRSRLSLSRPDRGGSSPGESFLVVVPGGVQPGDPFTLSVDGMRFTVTCPRNAHGGKRIRFHLPPRYCQQLRKRRSQSGFGSTGSFGSSDNLKDRHGAHCGHDRHHESLIETFRLDYDVEGWTRTLMLTNDGGKFQWARVHSSESSHDTAAPHAQSVSKALHKNARVRSITEDNLLLLPASQALIDSTVLSLTKTPTVLASCTDIITNQSKTLSEKVAWLQSVCAQLHRPPQSDPTASFSPHSDSVHLSIRREHLLQDSMTAVLSMDPANLHRTWRIHFHNEDGIDAGGLTREWFHLISTTLLDVSNGYWCTAKGGGNQMHLQIHPNYELLGGGCGDYNFYFRFLGRVMAKALVTSQLLSDGHFVPYLYKMILGWPITFSDLQPLDLEYYNSLICLVDMMEQEQDQSVADEMLANACLDFTVVEDLMGHINVVELKPNGANIDVTRDNMLEFMELVLNYRLVKRVEEPLRAMLLGFHDVIPQSLLTIFDFQELELMLCGMPNINVDDWFANTDYSGLYDVYDAQDKRKMHTVCMWFWTVVHEMNDEWRARLLQFVTGTSGVPAKGFGALQGSDGDIRRFLIHSVSLEECIYPRAHTCFNRIDLPVYQSREDLKEKLQTAITLVSTGFDLE